jgi:hypothetical protein
MPRILTLSLAALLGALPLAPQAQDRPVLFPQRDVTITYRLPDNAGEMQVSWLAARRLMRTDMPGGMGFGVMDLQTGTGFMAMPQQRLIMDIPRGQFQGRTLAPSERARFAREGQDRIAGIPCTVWRVEDQGEATRVCMTADGISLRAEGINRANSRVEATAVTYAVQDPARFQRPQGYQAFQMPAGIPGLGGTPGAASGGGLPRGTALPPPGVNVPPR